MDHLKKYIMYNKIENKLKKNGNSISYNDKSSRISQKKSNIYLKDIINKYKKKYLKIEQINYLKAKYLQSNPNKEKINKSFKINSNKNIKKYKKKRNESLIDIMKINDNSIDINNNLACNFKKIEKIKTCKLKKKNIFKLKYDQREIKNKLLNIRKKDKNYYYISNYYAYKQRDNKIIKFNNFNNFNNFYKLNHIFRKNFKKLLIKPYFFEVDFTKLKNKMLIPYNNQITYRKIFLIKLIKPFLLYEKLIDKLKQKIKFIMKNKNKLIIIDVYSIKNSYITIIPIKNFLFTIDYKSYWKNIINNLLNEKKLSKIKNIGYYKLIKDNKQNIINKEKNINLIEGIIKNINLDLKINKLILFN